MPSGFRRWSWWRRWLGQKAERIAVIFLKQRGFHILAVNLNDRMGELDILAIDQGMLVVVEVRSSESRSVHELAETVDLEKQKRIANTALRFLARRRLAGTTTIRFDVLTIRIPRSTSESIGEASPVPQSPLKLIGEASPVPPFKEKPEFLYIPNAFQAPPNKGMY